MTTPAAVRLEDVDMATMGFWAQPLEIREGVFQALRQERPIAFFEEPDYSQEGVPVERGRGFYALTKYRDVIDASRQPNLFCSGKGATSVPDMPVEMLEFFGSMINMDDPRHKRLRDIVGKAFTVRQIRQIDGYIQKTADEIIASLRDKREFDFVTECAAKLPLKVICDMMGVPPDQHQTVFDMSNVILGFGDPEYVPEGGDMLSAIMNAALSLTGLMNDLAAKRQADPTDDLTSALIHAEVDGDKLSHGELASFFILLVVAGNETTRNAISWGMLTLDQHRAQRERWMADFDGHARGAVEEIVRWATPVIFMRRTVTQDGARLSDVEFKEGDKVLLYYNSANRDEEVFDDPYRFDIARDPNNHVGFGGPGPHFCLGANLARQEIRVMFNELFTHLPTIEVAGEPQRLLSNFINGIKHLPAHIA